MNATQRAPSPLKTNLLIAVMCVIWGTTWLVVKKGVADLPPFTSATLRMALAAILMAALSAILAKREGGEKPSLKLSLIMGFGNFAITYGIVYWASTILPSGLIALLWAVYPLMMAIASHFYLEGERLRPLQWLGFLVSFAGVAILKTDLEAFGEAAPLAAMVVLISPLASCLATAYVKKHGANVSSNLLNRNGLIVSIFPLLAMVLTFERDASIKWTGFAIFSVAYLAVMGTVVTFGIYYYLLRFAAAYKLSLIAFITPAIAMAVGVFLGNEAATPRILLGAGFILSGVILVVIRKR